MNSFRELYEQIIDYQGNKLYKDILEPATQETQQLIAPLSNFQRLHKSLPEAIEHEALWTFFALQVLNDYLLLPLRISKEEYQCFFQALGFEVFKPNESFHPALCEIVEVGNWPKKEEGISIGTCYWPGLRFGEMIFSRCAVDVCCHPSFGIIEGIADESPLYFTYRRINRETFNLSQGWGSNSRWRTSFSRNYVTNGYVFLNVDGKHDLANLNSSSKDILDSLPLHAACELLLNRCFVQYQANAEECFPYRWKLAIKNDLPLWPLEDSKIVPFEEALLLLSIN